MTQIIERFSSQQELINDAALDFKRRLNECPHAHFDVAFLGGQTAIMFFQALIKTPISQEHWKKVRFFVSDEREAVLTSEQSNAGNLLRLLLKPLGINENQLFPLYDAEKGPELSALEYERLLQTLLKHQDGLPSFDLIYLGLGSDGHTASLFPNDSLVLNLLQGHEKRLVAHTIPKTTKEARMTFCPALINQAHQVIFLAAGAEKQKAIEEVIHGELNELLLPAQLIWRRRHKDTLFMRT